MKKIDILISLFIFFYVNYKVVKGTIYAFLLSLCFLLLFSCATPAKLIDRAVRRDPTILKDNVDTVRIKTVEVIGSSSSIDTAIIDNEYVFIKSFNSGDSIDLSYILKERYIDTIFKTKSITIYDTVIIKKTRQIVRLEAKQKRVETKEGSHTKRVEIRKDKKVEIATKKSERLATKKKSSFLSNVWIFIKAFIGAMISLFIGFLIGRMTRIFNYF
jgi:hypothetical protein